MILLHNNRFHQLIMLKTCTQHCSHIELKWTIKWFRVNYSRLPFPSLRPQPCVKAVNWRLCCIVYYYYVLCVLNASGVCSLNKSDRIDNAVSLLVP